MTLGPFPLDGLRSRGGLICVEDGDAALLTEDEIQSRHLSSVGVDVSTICPAFTAEFRLAFLFVAALQHIDIGLDVRRP